MGLCCFLFWIWIFRFAIRGFRSWFLVWIGIWYTRWNWSWIWAWWSTMSGIARRPSDDIIASFLPLLGTRLGFRSFGVFIFEFWACLPIFRIEILGIHSEETDIVGVLRGRCRDGVVAYLGFNLLGWWMSKLFLIKREIVWWPLVHFQPQPFTFSSFNRKPCLEFIGIEYPFLLHIEFLWVHSNWFFFQYYKGGHWRV